MIRPQSGSKLQQAMEDNMSNAPSSKEDVFGTYLEGISGLTLVDKILRILTVQPTMTVSQLAAEVGSMPEETVSAVLQAERSGFVKLEKTGDDTVVMLIKRPAAA